MNSPLRSLVRLLAVFVVVMAFNWWILLHFESPVGEIQPRYETGIPATLEQIVLAIGSLGFIFSEVWNGPFVDQRIVFPVFGLQFWPAFILAIRPWSSLSLWTRRGLIGYNALWLIYVVGIFVAIRENWHHIARCCP